MKKPALLLALFLMGSISSPLWAAPLQALDASPQARWVIHADLEALRASRLQVLVEKTSLSNDLAAARARFLQSFQIDPSQLNSITLHGREFQPAQSGVLILRGRVDWRETLRRLAEPSHKTNVIIRPLESGVDPVYSLHQRLFLQPQGSDRLVISPSRQELRAVSDGDPAAGPPILDDRNNPKETFLLALADMGAPGLVLPARASVLKKAESGRIVLGETNQTLQLQVTLKAREEESALQMQQALQGLAALLQLGEGRDPLLVALAQSARVSLTNQVVTLHLALPLERAVSALEAGAKARRLGPSAPALPPAPAGTGSPQP